MSQVLNMHQFGVAIQHEVNQHEVETLQRSFEAYRSHIIGQYALDHSDLVANVKAAEVNRTFVASAVDLLPPLENDAFRTDDELVLNTICATTYWDLHKAYIRINQKYIKNPRYIIGKSETDILLAHPNMLQPVSDKPSSKKRQKLEVDQPRYIQLETQSLKRIKGRPARKRLVRNFDTIDETDILSEQDKNECFDENSLKYVLGGYGIVSKGVQLHIFGAIDNFDTRTRPQGLTGRLHNTEMIKYGVVQRLAFMAVRFGKIVEFNEELSKLQNSLAEIYGSGDEIRQDVAAAIRLQK
jgi:hypothetical protein